MRLTEGELKQTVEKEMKTLYRSIAVMTGALENTRTTPDIQHLAIGVGIVANEVYQLKHLVAKLED